jgi:hypothetical protein
MHLKSTLLSKQEPGYRSPTELSYGPDDRGFESKEGLGIFLFNTASKPALGPTQLPIQWVTGAPYLWLKQTGCEADHSSPFSAEFRNA